MLRAISILAVLLLAATAQATIVKSVSVEEMAKTADVIVVGEVLSRTSSWNDAKTRIYTVTRVRVGEAIKGSTGGAEIQIRQIGGTLDGLTQQIVGNAKLAEGEEVLVFLDRDETLPFHYVVGMAQGKFSIDRKSGIARVRRSMEGLALAKVVDRQIKTFEHAPKTEEAPTLDAFRAQITAALAPKPVP